MNEQINNENDRNYLKKKKKKKKKNQFLAISKAMYVT